MTIEQIIDLLEERRNQNRTIADSLTPARAPNERDVIMAQVAFQIAQEYEALINALRAAPR